MVEVDILGGHIDPEGAACKTAIGCTTGSERHETWSTGNHGGDGDEIARVRIIRTDRTGLFLAFACKAKGAGGENRNIASGDINREVVETKFGPASNIYHVGVTVAMVDAKKSTLGGAEVVGRNVRLKCRDKKQKLVQPRFIFLVGRLVVGS